MKPWTVQEEILRRVKKEAEWEWAKNENKPNFPVYKKADNIVNNVGWRNLLRQLKP